MKFGLRTMKSLRKIAVCCGIVLLALAVALRARTPQSATPSQKTQQGSAAAAPQNPSPPPQQQQKPAQIISTVTQVIVPVTVKDGSGRLVADLRRDEFRILEDNVEQRIVSLSAEALPLSVVLLID